MVGTNRSDCFLVILVDAKGIDYSTAQTFLQTMHKHPRGNKQDRSAGHAWRLGRFPNLMQRRIQEVLLVSSPYDAFILEEDGLLTEMISTEFVDLGLSESPNVARVATGEEALTAIRSRRWKNRVSASSRRAASSRNSCRPPEMLASAGAPSP